MQPARVWGLGGVALAGTALASCNLMLGFDRYFDAGDKGSSASSAHGGADGGGGGTGGTGGAVLPPGAALWAHALGTSGEDTVKAIAVSPMTGNIFLTGKTGAADTLGCPNVVPDAGPSTGGYLIEVNEQGHCIWGLFFGLGAEGTGVAVDSNDNLALTGTFTGDLSLYDLTPPTLVHQSAFVARIRANRTSPWAHLISSKGANTVSTTGVAMTTQHVYFGGFSNGELNIDFTPGTAPLSGGQDGFVLDCVASDAGTCKVGVTVSGTGTTDQQVLGVAANRPGDELSIAGVSGGDTGFNSAIVTMAPAGASMSPNAIVASFLTSNYSPRRGSMFGGGKPQTGQCVAYDDAGALLFAGTYDTAIKLTTSSLSSKAAPSVFLTRFDPMMMAATKQVSLTAGLTGTGNDEDVHGLTADATGNVVMVGTLRGTASLGSLSATSVGGDDIYVARLDAALNPLWLASFGGVGAESADAVALAADGDIIVTGHFDGKLSFGKDALTSKGGNDIFIAKLKAH